MRALPPRQTVTCATGQITYRESDGDADAVPVVCLHGIGGDDTSFAAQFRGCGDRRVIAWNMPGYGGSARMASMDFGGLAAVVTDFMDALGVSRAHLVGQSIGGMIAQEVAIRTPDRVAGLGLIATVSAFGGRDDSFKDAFLKARLAPLEAGTGMARLAQEGIGAVIGPDADTATRDMAIAAMAAIDPDIYRQVLGCLVTFNRRDDQHRLTMPCCLIAGGLDDNSPARVMAKMAEKLPDATFHIIDRAGHLVNSEHPDMVNALLRAFFDRVK